MAERMDPSTRAEADRNGLWTLVRLEEFRRPARPAAEAVRKGLLGLWDRLRGSSNGAEEAVAEKDLCTLPDGLMKDVMPGGDRTEVAAALKRIHGTVSNGGAAAVNGFAVLRTSGDGIASAIRAMAEEEGWAVPPPLKGEEILAGGEAFLESLLRTADVPLAIPELESFYIRHYMGFGFLRRLFEILVATGRPCIVGCDSWAWAFLSRSLGIDRVLKPVYTLDAFDGERLQRWFGEAAAGAFQRGFSFRQADSGRYVLRPPPENGPESARGDSEQGAEQRGAPVEVTDFLRHVASYSRGLPGVALAIWRFSLRFAYEAEVEEKAQKAAAVDRGATIWVKPWSRVTLPSLPAGRQVPLHLILHALLLHGRLDGRMLQRILPLSGTDIMAGLATLVGCGVVEAGPDGSWQVGALGYPAVDDALRGEGYLAGAF